MVKQVGEQSMSMPEVTRMPEVLAWFDKSEVVRRLPPDFKLEADHALVRFDVDVDVSGRSPTSGRSRGHSHGLSTGRSFYFCPTRKGARAICR